MFLPGGETTVDHDDLREFLPSRLHRLPATAYLLTGDHHEAETLRLPKTAPEGKPTGSAATAVRNEWVSAVVTVNLDGGFAIESAVWNLGTGDVKLTPPLGSKNAVNAQGWPAGRGIGGLMLVTGSREVQLPLPTGASHGRWEDVHTLSDDGATVAGEVNPLNDTIPVRALVWHCS